MKSWMLCSLLFLTKVSARIFRENMHRTSTIFTRTTAYSPEVKYKVCLLRPQEGPCRSKINMYYFKKSSMNCAQFDWGGCQGNGNRFDTEEECLDYCLTKEGYTPPPPSWCQLTFDYGSCFGEVDQYYYDPKREICQTAKYSGCGGNKNKFNTKELCESVCLFGKNLTTKSDQQTTTDKGFSTVLVVDPEETPRSRTSVAESTSTSNADSQTGARPVRRASPSRFTRTIHEDHPQVTEAYMSYF